MTEFVDIKTAAITGGAQGIGRIIADTLLTEGWNVAVWDNDEEALAQEAKRFKGNKNRIGLCCNVTCAGSVSIAFQETIKKFGRIDLLINNAAIHANKPIAQLEISEFRRVIDVNLTGAFICAKTCEEELRKTRGSIINICSTRAFQSEADTEAYSASKGGIFALTHALAVSLGPDIRVNCISPGWIDVSSVRKSQTAKQVKLSEADHLQHPAGRVGVAADIARMVLFLANKENSFITAQNFVVDGGMTRKMIYV
jgi:NAD(P)-dependent dehydrogenase (short-subunit alcohol dehydrogenase family)